MDDESVRHKQALSFPEAAAEPAAASIGYNLESEVEIRHTPPIRGGFAELQKKGLKIKDYHTTERQ